MARSALDLGFYISLSGIVTFRNADALREVARQVPADRLLVETDSPYLAPIPPSRQAEPAGIRARCRRIPRDVVASAWKPWRSRLPPFPSAVSVGPLGRQTDKTRVLGDESGSRPLGVEQRYAFLGTFTGWVLGEIPRASTFSIGHVRGASRQGWRFFKQIWNTLAVLEYLGACDLAQDRQGIVDHRRTRVEVRGKTDTSATLGANDPFLAKRFEECPIVLAVQAEGQDARASARVPRAVQAYPGNSPTDRPVATGRARRCLCRPAPCRPPPTAPGWPPGPSRRACSGCRIRSAGAARRPPVATLVIEGMFQHVPAIFVQRQALALLGMAIEDAQPFGAEHPLVPIGHGEGTIVGLYVEGQGAELLDRVDAEQHPAAATSRADALQVRRRPLAYCTALIDSRRVRGPQAASRALSGSSPARPTSTTSTPRGRKASQTTLLEGNSSLPMTTWSPSRQSRPKATKESASEVFLTRARSLPARALSSRARRSRRRCSIFSHSG